MYCRWTRVKRRLPHLFALHFLAKMQKAKGQPVGRSVAELRIANGQLRNSCACLCLIFGHFVFLQRSNVGDIVDAGAKVAMRFVRTAGT